MLKKNVTWSVLAIGVAGSLWACGSDDNVFPGGAGGASSGAGGHSGSAHSAGSGGKPAGAGAHSGGAPEAGAPEAGAPEAGAPEAGAPSGGAPSAGSGGSVAGSGGSVAGSGGSVAGSGGSVAGSGGSVAGSGGSVAGSGGSVAGSGGSVAGSGGSVAGSGGSVAGSGGAPGNTLADQCAKICADQVGLACPTPGCVDSCTGIAEVTVAPDEYAAMIACEASMLTSTDYVCLAEPTPSPDTAQSNFGMACETEICTWTCLEDSFFDPSVHDHCCI